MKRFKFKLEKLLEIKKDIEFKAKLRYAQVLQKKINIEMENAAMQNSIYETINSDSMHLNSDNVLSYERMAINEKYIRGLEKKIKQNELLKLEVEKELLKLRDELIEATKEKKKLEQLEKKQFEKYKAEQKKHETKVMDDMAGRFYQRHREQQE
jgi:flagellar FliJ protein